MDNLHDYHVRFFDSQGTVIEGASFLAGSLSAATARAEEIAKEVGVVNFIVTSIPPKHSVV
jgi:hypothetical protein